MGEKEGEKLLSFFFFFFFLNEGANFSLFLLFR